MKSAAAYIRVSTDEQTEYSPDSQLKAIRRFAENNGISLCDDYIFIDEGISGRSAEKRPAFQKMIGTAKLKPKPFDVVLIWKFSRFARNREDSIVYKSMLRKQCGIEVISVSEQLSEDKTSVLIEALIEAMDEYYSLNLAEEVKRGMNEKFSRGGVISPPPFGYRAGEGTFIPDLENSAAVQMIFYDFLNGMSTRQIARKLNAMGIRSVKGNLFEGRTVEYILTNPVYIGMLRKRIGEKNTSDRFYQFSDEVAVVKGTHQPLIDEAVFNEVQEKLLHIKSIYPRYSRNESSEYMLKGLVRCDSCGGTLVRQRASESLQCHRYAKGLCNVSHGISLKKMNDAIIGRLKNDFGDSVFDVNVKPCTKKNESNFLLNALENERKKLERIRVAYESGVDTLYEYRQNKENIQKSINELIKLLEAEKSEAPEKYIHGSLSCCIDILESGYASEALKNQIIRTVVERIVYVKSESTVQLWYR
ncbi:MAG: recombinase family protein [Ruminococcus sp.]|nr:recombinase family protein [Ruminococcus sp.]